MRYILVNSKNVFSNEQSAFLILIISIRLFKRLNSSSWFLFPGSLFQCIRPDSNSNHHIAKFQWSDSLKRVQFNHYFWRYYGKTNFENQRNFNANSALVAFVEIRFRSLFFGVEKRRQYSEVSKNFHCLNKI